MRSFAKQHFAQYQVVKEIRDAGAKAEQEALLS